MEWREYLKLYAWDLMYSRNETRVRNEFGILWEVSTYCMKQLKEQESRSNQLVDILWTL